MVIEKKVLKTSAPKVLAANSKRESTPEKPTDIALYTKGYETTAAAKAVAHQVKISSIPKLSCKNEPITLFLPKVRSNKNPMVTGGKAKGTIPRISIKILSLTLRLIENQASNVAIGKLIKVATTETLRLTSKEA